MVHQLTEATIDEVVELAIKEAPTSEVDKTASEERADVPENRIFKISESLNKLAGEIESQEEASLKEFKVDNSEKTAAFKEIISTYVELETK